MLIQDRDNPTGMFSKAGRLSIEMFALLQEKESIMQNKKKVFHVKQLPFEEKKTSKQNNEPLTKMKSQSPGETRRGFKSPTIQAKSEQPFAKVRSRQNLDDISEKVRINNQKFGMYNPNYHFIYEKSAFYSDEDFLAQQKQNYTKQRTIQSPRERKPQLKKHLTVQDQSPSKSKGQQSASILNKQKSQELNQSLSMVTNEVDSKFLVAKVKGNLHFSRMVNRKPFIDGPGPHEKRFDYLELPSIYSNVKKPLNVYFKSSSKANVFALKQSGLQYDINFDSIYPKSVKMVANFEKNTARSFPMKPVYTLDESLVDTSLYKQEDLKSPKSQLLKKIPGLSFTLMLARDCGSNKLFSSASQHINSNS